MHSLLFDGWREILQLQYKVSWSYHDGVLNLYFLSYCILLKFEHFYVIEYFNLLVFSTEARINQNIKLLPCQSMFSYTIITYSQGTSIKVLYI